MHSHVLVGAVLSVASLSMNLVAASTQSSVNHFAGKNYYANYHYAGMLNQTVAAFLAKNDTLNAARARTVQNTGTFFWITAVAGLFQINNTIAEARAVQRRTGIKQIIQLVLYDIPDRDCAGGASSGEFTFANNGLELYKHTFVDPYAATLKAASDLEFAVILEPDSLGNVIQNQAIPLCATATPGIEAGVAYAIAKLQSSNIALYVDAAAGGWFAWDGNFTPVAAEFSKVVKMAANITSGATIRGFSTDVSNFNPYIANPRASYTQYSVSYDELHYVETLAPYLKKLSLPAKFIIDQGRSGLQNTRTSWGEWCNVEAGFGIRPTTVTNSSLVDSIVWAKPGGESDGPCGPTIDGQTAPSAGSWWEAYAEALIINANPPLKATYTS